MQIQELPERAKSFLQKSGCKLLHISNRSHHAPDLIYIEPSTEDSVFCFYGTEQNRVLLTMGDICDVHKRAGCTFAFCETKSAGLDHQLNWRGWHYPKTIITPKKWRSNEEGSWYIASNGKSFRVQHNGIVFFPERVPEFTCELVFVPNKNKDDNWFIQTVKEIEEIIKGE